MQKSYRTPNAHQVQTALKSAQKIVHKISQAISIKPFKKLKKIPQRDCKNGKKNGHKSPIFQFPRDD
jgi:hypothetical protein